MPQKHFNATFQLYIFAGALTVISFTQRFSRIELVVATGQPGNKKRRIRLDSPFFVSICPCDKVPCDKVFVASLIDFGSQNWPFIERDT